MLLASIPLSGLLLLAPQQTPPPAPLDPQLQTAIDELRQSSGHRFVADGIELLPFDPSAPLAGTSRRAHGPLTRLADVLAAATSAEVRGRIEHKKPVFLATGSIQAFREDGKLVFRRRLRANDAGRETTLDARDEWGPWTDLNDVGDADERMELRLLRLVARLPAPEELLAELGERATNCVATPDPKREGRTTFECQIRPDAGWKLGLETSAPAQLQRCTLRIVVDHGRVAELGLEGVAAPDAAPSAIPVADDAKPAIELSVRYRIHDVGTTKLVVPDEVVRRLGSR